VDGLPATIRDTSALGTSGRYRLGAAPFGELNDFSSNTATHELAPQAESQRSWLFAFSRDFRRFLAPDAVGGPSAVRRDHSGYEREPWGYVRTPNVSRTNSPTLPAETTHGLTAPLPLSALGNRDKSGRPEDYPATFRTMSRLSGSGAGDDRPFAPRKRSLPKPRGIPLPKPAWPGGPLFSPPFTRRALSGQRLWGQRRPHFSFAVVPRKTTGRANRGDAHRFVPEPRQGDRPERDRSMVVWSASGRASRT
jgi:hypothetical protein